MNLCQVLITRLPYAVRHNIEPLVKFMDQVDLRGLSFISIPLHVENPNIDGQIICELEKAGFILVAKIVWQRDRLIICSKSKRLSNMWETIAVFSRSPNYILNRDAPAKVKRGYESKESAFTEEEFLTCIGDHWTVSNDRRDRRFLPQTIVLNCAQLAGLHPEDTILDPFGIPSIKETCKAFNWNYKDGGLKSDIRGLKKVFRKTKLDSVEDTFVEPEFPVVSEEAEMQADNELQEMEASSEAPEISVGQKEIKVEEGNNGEERQ